MEQQLWRLNNSTGSGVAATLGGGTTTLEVVGRQLWNKLNNNSGGGGATALEVKQQQLQVMEQRWMWNNNYGEGGTTTLEKVEQQLWRRWNITLSACSY